jgi:YD repeat-containing protein
VVSNDLGGGVVWTYTYDSKGNIITINRISGSASQYGYDSNNNLVAEDVTFKSLPAYRMTYQYNSSGQMTSNLYTSLTDPDLTFTSTFQYSNTSTKNPSTLVLEGLLGKVVIPAITTRYEYDDRPNPLKSFFPSITSDNNVTKSTVTNQGKTTVESFVYQYNSNGYPTSSSSSAGMVNTFTYDCK